MDINFQVRCEQRRCQCNTKHQNTKRVKTYGGVTCWNCEMMLVMSRCAVFPLPAREKRKRERKRGRGREGERERERERDREREREK